MVNLADAQTWTQTTAPHSIWISLASSADGTRLAAVDARNIWTSTDSGTTWETNNMPNQFWGIIASSADGRKLVAAISASTGGIWTSYTTPAPQLNLTSFGGNLALSWIVPATNLVLQQNLDLTTANWLTMTDVPCSISPTCKIRSVFHCPTAAASFVLSHNDSICEFFKRVTASSKGKK